MMSKKNAKVSIRGQMYIHHKTKKTNQNISLKIAYQKFIWSGSEVEKSWLVKSWPNPKKHKCKQTRNFPEKLHI